MGKWILLGTIIIRKILFYGSNKANGVILEDAVAILQTTNALAGWAFAMQSSIAFSMSPLVAVLTSTLGTRRMGIAGGLMTGIGYVYSGVFFTSVVHLFLGMIVTGTGFNLVTVPPHMALQHYCDADELQSTMAFLALFDYAGVAVIPLIMQQFQTHYGLKSSLILLGALLWNTIATGIAARSPKNSKYNKFIKKNKGETYDVVRVLTTLPEHPNVFIMVAIEFLCAYIFMSWSLFLVSLGSSLGLSKSQSVLLSTAGGIGGFIGKLFVLVLIRAGMFNAITSTLIPCLTTATVFSLVWLLDSFYLILGMIFVSGFGLGVIGSVCVVTPTISCPLHYRTLVILEYSALGIGSLLGGLLSGAIEDLGGSAVSVYLFNAFLCLSVVPLSVWWACHQTDLNCSLQSEADTRLLPLAEPGEDTCNGTSGTGGEMRNTGRLDHS